MFDQAFRVTVLITTQSMKELTQEEAQGIAEKMIVDATKGLPNNPKPPTPTVRYALQGLLHVSTPQMVGKEGQRK
jgi:hypothetical protein